MAKIADIIKYEGDNATFVWKHPCEDFNSFTQLIVHESQEAIFMLNGQVLDVFAAGRYTLETQNIPKLGKILNFATGNRAPFHAEIYFVNKTEQMAIKWGVGGVQFIEPTYGFPLTIGASGEMSLRAVDAKKLLLKLVGTEKELTQAKVVQYFRGVLTTRIKSELSQTIKAKKINVFEIDERLQEFSEELRAKVRDTFNDYGVVLERFYVTGVVKPDGDPQYEKFKSLHFRQYADIAEAKLRQQVGIIEEQTRAQQTIIESQALAQKRAQEGYTYQQERGFDVAEGFSKNEGAGQFANMGIGLGLMSGVGGVMTGVVGNAVQNVVNDTQGTTQQRCVKCGYALPNKAKFCPECGERIKTYCVKCGAEINGSKYCTECGEKQ